MDIKNIDLEKDQNSSIEIDKLTNIIDNESARVLDRNKTVNIILTILENKDIEQITNIMQSIHYKLEYFKKESIKDIIYK